MKRRYWLFSILLLFTLVVGCCAGLKKESPKKRPLIPPRVAPPPGKKFTSCTEAVDTKYCVNKTVTIAVIDTGFMFNEKTKNARLCKFGHKDFSRMQQFSTEFGTVVPVPTDNHGHGTNIAGIIDSYVKNSGVDYCIVILKYYDPKASDSNNLKSTIAAVKYANAIKADFINYSGGGIEFSKDEKDAVQKFLDRGGRFVAAAGNERANVDKFGNKYYPALYEKRIISVGNLNKNGTVAPSSNFGEAISCWEVGEDVIAYDIPMTGTSQAAAVATGKLVSKLKDACR